MQAWINSIIAMGIGALMALSGFATLLQPDDKALKLPFTGKILTAFSRADTLRFVKVNGLFLLVSGTLVSLFAAIATINNLGTLTWTP